MKYKILVSNFCLLCLLDTTPCEAWVYYRDFLQPPKILYDIRLSNVEFPNAADSIISWNFFFQFKWKVPHLWNLMFFQNEKQSLCSIDDLDLEARSSSFMS